MDPTSENIVLSETPPPAQKEFRLVDVEVIDENVALNLMVSFLSLAQKRGSFGLDESAKIWECVKKWDSTVKTALPAQGVAELKKTVPEIFTSSAVAPSATVSNKIIKLLQNNANFNILSGTLILRWLIERFSTVQTGGQLNKAMVAYNAGAYIRALNVSSTQPITNPIDSTSLATNRQVPAESRGYLYKMLGKDGFLSLIYIDKVI